MRDELSIEKLKQVIYNELKELECCKYALFDLPYHTNIGDGLIWEGERCFLDDIGAKCLHSSSNFTCDFPKLTDDVFVLIHGGGNVGDLYREHFDFHKKVIAQYPKQRILFFPQTIFYKDERILKEDMEFIGRHGNVTLCVRDRRSYDLVTKYFSGVVKLVPDMAFAIPKKCVDIPVGSKTLAIIRKDGELDDKSSDFFANIVADKKDWPTFYHRPFDGTFVYKSLAKLAHWQVWGFKTILNVYCRKYFSVNLLRIGLSFFTPYKEIYTTRLHGCILGILTGRKIFLLDNSYGKNSSFYETWLKEFEGVDYIKL